MKISDGNVIRPAASSSVRRRSNVGGTSFLDYLSEANEATAPGEAAPAEAAAPASFNTMLALQEMPDEEIRRKKTIARGHSALDQLENLRHSLLTGRMPAYLLRNLSNLLSGQRAATADPRLKEIIDEIELRAAVELAKLEVAQLSQYASLPPYEA